VRARTRARLILDRCPSVRVTILLNVTFEANPTRLDKTSETCRARNPNVFTNYRGNRSWKPNGTRSGPAQGAEGPDLIEAKDGGSRTSIPPLSGATVILLHLEKESLLSFKIFGRDLDIQSGIFLTTRASSCCRATSTDARKRTYLREVTLKCVTLKRLCPLNRANCFGRCKDRETHRGVAIAKNVRFIRRSFGTNVTPRSVQWHLKNRTVCGTSRRTSLSLPPASFPPYHQARIKETA